MEKFNIGYLRKTQEVLEKLDTLCKTTTNINTISTTHTNIKSS